jgi:hypothetical protein
VRAAGKEDENAACRDNCGAAVPFLFFVQKKLRGPLNSFRRPQSRRREPFVQVQGGFRLADPSQQLAGILSASALQS